MLPIASFVSGPLDEVACSIDTLLLVDASIPEVTGCLLSRLEGAVLLLSVRLFLLLLLLLLTLSWVMLLLWLLEPPPLPAFTDIEIFVFGLKPALPPAAPKYDFSSPIVILERAAAAFSSVIVCDA